MSTGDITARESVEPQPSSVLGCNSVFILQCFPSSNRTTAQDELLQNGRTQEPSVRTAVFHAEDQTSDLLRMKYRKYLTLSCCHTLTDSFTWGSTGWQFLHMKMEMEITAETSPFLYKKGPVGCWTKFYMLQHVRGKQHTKNTMYGAGGKSSGVD
jgi:hypothetical protein